MTVNEELIRFDGEVDLAIEKLRDMLSRLRGLGDAAPATLPGSGSPLIGVPPWVTPIWTELFNPGGLP